MSTYALIELDQCPDAEARTLGTMCNQVQAIRRRYPAEHPIGDGLDAALCNLSAAMATYEPYLTPSFEVR